MPVRKKMIHRINGWTIALLLLLSTEARYGYSFERSILDNLVSQTVQSYEKITSYQCYFSKKEFVDGKIIETNKMNLKFMKPQHFYLRYTEGKDKGIEAIFIEGKNKNKLIVHLNGLLRFITVSLDPNGSLAMRDNRHPITHAGVGYIVKIIEENYTKARNDNDCDVKLNEEVKIGGRTTIPIFAKLPKDKGYYSHIIHIFIDKELFLPVKIIAYGWNNEFMEEYLFEDIQIQAGLTENDFDTKNPDYQF